ncbi:MAG: AMP-binding protein [Treponema sp.]|uniref:AMP-dependent synthetase/ligase n=1 Tax=Treponema sp. TaxID=166 RepID=UPI001D58AE0F|nr:AMP-binding protein [Treponema sp.]MBS7310671.1 AMP-binding protein [Treponema sp.]
MEKTLPRMLREVSQKYPDIPAQMTRISKEGDFETVTYKELYDNSQAFAGGLLALGTVRGEKVGLISDNRKEWEQADMGIMTIGACDVPRGCDASEKDLKYILSFTEVKTCIVENEFQIRKILNVKDEIPTLKRFIIFEEPTENEVKLCKEAKIDLLRFYDVVEDGKKYNEKNPGKVEAEIEAGQWDDIAAIIFTSGTTGVPKGVTLSHGNFITQLDELQERIYLKPAERAICVLPVWHVFQRLVEYVIISQAAVLCYSKPIGSILLPDMLALNPTLLPAVPRVFEAVYEGITKKMRRTGGIVEALFNFFTAIAICHSWMDRKMFRKNFMTHNEFTPGYWLLFIIPWLLLYPWKLLGNVLVFKKVKAMLGTNFRAGVAGGGAYPKAIDQFFWALEINVVEGYGMTETAPVVAVRPVDAPIFGCIGTPIRGVSARIVDMEGNVLKPGNKGVLQIKGGTVMKGYYKRPELTEKAISPDGWLDTGDLAIESIHGELKILGRVKDTIVLTGGENIEPLPLEAKMQESRFIQTAVVVGQDQRNLGALILPNQEELELWANENNISFKDFEDLVKKPEAYKLIEDEIKELINAKNGFRMFEKIVKFAFLTKPFEVGKELSAKQEIMRYKLTEIYEKEIKGIFKD